MYNEGIKSLTFIISLHLQCMQQVLHGIMATTIIMTLYSHAFSKIVFWIPCCVSLKSTTHTLWSIAHTMETVQFYHKVKSTKKHIWWMDIWLYYNQFLFNFRNSLWIFIQWENFIRKPPRISYFAQLQGTRVLTI